MTGDENKPQRSPWLDRLVTLVLLLGAIGAMLLLSGAR